MDMNRHMSSNQVIGAVEYFILEFFLITLLKYCYIFCQKELLSFILTKIHF